MLHLLGRKKSNCDHPNVIPPAVGLVNSDKVVKFLDTKKGVYYYTPLSLNTLHTIFV
jgi:hypothetical protein